MPIPISGATSDKDAKSIRSYLADAIKGGASFKITFIGLDESDGTDLFDLSDLKIDQFTGKKIRDCMRNIQKAHYTKK